MPDIDMREHSAKPAYAWFVVAALSLLQVGSYIDRMVINLLVEPMRRDFQISDTQVSLLLGFAFATFYAVMAIPAGRLVDKHSRVRIIVIGVLFWSVATLLCMVADGYWTLLFARMLVGLGEAALLPAALSILSDYFRPGRLALATSVVTSASFVGSGLALVMAGYVLSQLPATEFVNLFVFGEVRTWQLAFGFASIPSLLFLGLFLFVKEPARTGLAKQKDTSASLRDALEYLRADKAMWISVFTAMSLVNAFQYGLTSWIPTFFIRTYGWTAGEIGQLYGMTFLVCATTGILTGGWLCDRLYGRFGRRTFVITPFISAVLTIPLVLTFALAGSGLVSAILVVPLTFFGTMAFGAAVAAIPSLAPNRLRGQLVAAYMLAGTLIGQGFGPWLIAVFTDYVMGDPMLISRSIAVVSTSLLAAAAAILAVGIRTIPRGNDIEAQIGETAA